MSRVVIVEPYSAGWWLIDRASALGHEPVVVTAHERGRRVPDRHLAHASHVEVVDTNDADATLAAVERLHDKECVHAVMPGVEYYVPLAARIGTALGLPALAPEAAIRLRLKHEMRRALASSGLDQPAFQVVHDEAELWAAVDRIGLPAVVKPVDQAGSVGVRKVTSLDEARDALAAVLRGHDVGMGLTGLPCALVEEYIDGPEYSVEGYVQHGRVCVLGATAKLVAGEPYFVEVGHIVPAVLPAPAAEAVADYVTEVTTALGLAVGPFHAEVRLSDRGPLLMEVAARLAGDRIPDLWRLARGVDLAEVMLRCYLGQPATATAARSGHAGIRFFLRPGLTEFAEVVVDDDIRADPRLREFAITAPPGRPVAPPQNSFSRLGYAVVTGSSYSEVRGLLDAVDRGTTFR